MRTFLLLLISICFCAATAQANDPYWDGYDDAQGGFWKRSDLQEYLKGYEHGQLEQEEEKTPVIAPKKQLNTIKKPTKIHQKYSKKDELIVKANRYGNYQTTGQINGRDVLFIIDTGASLVSISKTTAHKLHLKYSKSKPIRMQTASGTDRAYLTTIKNISIGNIVLHDVQAAVSSHNFPQYPLLGMSFLTQLDLHHNGNTMTLRKR